MTMEFTVVFKDKSGNNLVGLVEAESKSEAVRKLKKSVDYTIVVDSVSQDNRHSVYHEVVR